MYYDKSCNFSSQKWAPGTKLENFEKIKKTPPGICLIYKCIKFQKIFKAYSLPQSFSSQKQSKIGPQSVESKI